MGRGCLLALQGFSGYLQGQQATVAHDFANQGFEDVADNLPASHCPSLMIRGFMSCAKTCLDKPPPADAAKRFPSLEEVKEVVQASVPMTSRAPKLTLPAGGVPKMARSTRKFSISATEHAPDGSTLPFSSGAHDALCKKQR